MNNHLQLMGISAVRSPILAPDILLCVRTGDEADKSRRRPAEQIVAIAEILSQVLAEIQQ